MADQNINIVDSEQKNESYRRLNRSKAQTSAEYFAALEKWLKDARAYPYNCGNGFPYAMMSQPLNSATIHTANFFPPHFQASHIIALLTQHGRNHFVPRPSPGVNYRIPPIWKRFCAELIDFMILFLIKLPITFIAVDFFDFVDLDKYDFDLLQQQNKINYKLALEMTSEILALEIVFRIIVCIFEGLFLLRGSTPGKSCMGLKVVLCRSLQSLENEPNVVKVVPAGPLGFWWSFARAILKNLVIALLFPICFPLFFNKFNRTGYDILCHSIVVEEHPLILGPQPRE